MAPHSPGLASQNSLIIDAVILLNSSRTSEVNCVWQDKGYYAIGTHTIVYIMSFWYSSVHSIVYIAVFLHR